MNCPVDNEVLKMSERQGVEVDYCPSCRGVWLDRGELDKIIDRASEELSTVSGGDRDDRRRDDDRGSIRGLDQEHSGAPRKKKRGSFLSEMFELGG